MPGQVLHLRIGTYILIWLTWRSLINTSVTTCLGKRLSLNYWKTRTSLFQKFSFFSH